MKRAATGHARTCILRNRFRAPGFRRIRLELEGFRSGSMDEEGRDRACEDLYIES